jgi:glycosyltransferase involved in cell wall biosynthesis
MAMKVALSLEALSPQLTGIGRYTWELANRLPTRLQKQNVGFFRNGQQIQSPQRLLRLQDQPFTLGTLLPQQVRNWQTKQWLRGRVVHGPNYFLPSYAESGVITVHDLSVFRYPETHPAERLRQFENLFKRSINLAQQIITDSEAIRQELISSLGISQDRVTSVSLGVSPRFRPMLESEVTDTLGALALTPGGYTLCVSTIEPRKRISHLLGAYRLLDASTRAMFPLVLAGASGWLNEETKSQIDAASKDGWLTYLSFVDETTLPALYAGASVFVFPSVYEGFGLPVLEAMASGVPVVTSNRSSLPEVTGEAAILVDPDDIESLRDALLRALHDNLWRAGAKAQGLARAELFTWDACVEKTISVYERVHL